MKDKIDLSAALYDALEDMIPQAKLKEIYGNRSDSDCAVGIYARTHPERSVIILDEAQNTTTHQIKMFLTRLGMNARW